MRLLVMRFPSFCLVSSGECYDSTLNRPRPLAVTEKQSQVDTQCAYGSLVHTRAQIAHSRITGLQ
jgi:hypothetical protein